MSRTTFIDLPRFVTVSLVAIVLAVIGFFLSAIVPSLIYAFPALRPSKPRAKRTRKRCRKLVPTRSIVSITQVNISQTSSPSLARPRQALTSRCRSIPANWDLSRGANPSKSSRPKLINRLSYVRRISQAVKKTAPANSLKTVKDTSSVLFGKALSSINAFAREEPIAEESVERTSVHVLAYQTANPVTNTSGLPADEDAEPPMDQSGACLRRTSTVQKLNAIFKPAAEFTISGATTNLIKTCKLNAPVGVVNKRSRQFVGAVVDIFPSSGAIARNGRNVPNGSQSNCTTAKRRPSLLRSVGSDWDNRRKSKNMSTAQP